MDEYRVEIGAVLYPDVLYPDIVYIGQVFYYAKCLLVAKSNMTRDEFEILALTNIFNTDIILDERSDVALRPVIMLGDTLDIPVCNESLLSHDTPMWQSQATPIWQSNDRPPWLSRDTPACVTLSYSHPAESGANIQNNANLFLNLVKTLSCSHAQFQPKMYRIEHITLPPFVFIILKFRTLELMFAEVFELNMLFIDTQGSLCVCRELLELKIKQFQQSSVTQPPVSAATKLAGYLLTWCCLLASIVCLLLTLTTYVRFAVLRTTAGKNNMFLCSSLLLAQTSLLAASETVGPSHLCTTLGITTHYLWLWMFAWCFTCSFHMFQVFTLHVRVPMSSREDKLVKKMVATLVLPAVVVAVVVVSSLVTSGGRDVGYGQVTCYLDSPLLIGLAMIFPLATMAVCNIGFFAATVYSINKIRQLQTAETFRRDDQINVFIYIKLSSMTGTFWTVAILAEVLDNDVLRFMSTVLNGLQGVFIFLSYTCNKRVLGLYMDTWRSGAVRTNTNLTANGYIPEAASNRNVTLITIRNSN